MNLIFENTVIQFIMNEIGMLPSVEQFSSSRSVFRSSNAASRGLSCNDSSGRTPAALSKVSGVQTVIP